MTATATDYRHSAYAESKRRLKAAYLMDALISLGIDAAAAVDLDDEQWKHAARTARVRIPSADTRRLVVDLLAHAESERKVDCPTCGHGNPAGGVGPVLPAGHAGECNR